MLEGGGMLEIKTTTTEKPISHIRVVLGVRVFILPFTHSAYT